MLRSTSNIIQTHNTPSSSASLLRHSQSDSQLPRTLGQFANKLKTIRENAHVNLKQNLQNNIPSSKLGEVGELIDLIESGEHDFESLNAHVGEFVEANKHSPEIIVNVLKYINSQLMILSGTEQNMKAEQFAANQSLGQGLTSLLAHVGGSADDVVLKMSEATVSPVFTAHPTNFNKPEASAIVLSQLEDISTPHGNARVCHELWQAQGMRKLPPTVQQEAQQFSSNIRHLHRSSRSIHKQLNQHLGTLPNAPTLSRPLIEAGNWVGGDRDGNPNIDAEVLQDVIKTLSTSAFEYFEKKIDVGNIRKGGSFCNLLCKAGHEEQVLQIREKLIRTREHLVGNSALPIQGDLYQNPKEMLQDLQALDTSSLSPADQNTLRNKMALLALDVESIGFHGASTDIRQNSAMNEKVVGGLLRTSGVGPQNYEKLDEPEKEKLLTDLLVNNTRLEPIFEPTGSEKDIASFKREVLLINSYKRIHDTYGPQALKNCITANTESMSDMLEVMVLLQHAGLADENNIQMNVVPLIETVDDLNNGPSILESMLKHPWYSKALQASGNLQQIMVGYSDSNRLDGPLSSSWAVYEGTAKMLEVANKHNVKLHVFHGRGGTEARGSGDSYSQEIKSHNGASMLTGMRQTEQGEEVPAKFGNRDLSQSNLSEMVGSTLEAMSSGADKQLAQYRPVMSELANHARSSYASLYLHPELPSFFQNTTPINFVGNSNAGSRPASRTAEPGAALILKDLRAIPWVGSWYQSGSAMPAFFGTGTALKTYIDNPNDTSTTPEQRTATLRTMYKEWPFFQSFVDRTASAMEKADMTIAKEYANLAPSESRNVFNQINDEFNLTRDMLLTVKQSNDLMSHNPVGAETIEVKKPLTQAAHAMQINLLKANQELGPDFKAMLIEPIVMSMQAISSANRFG